MRWRIDAELRDSAGIAWFRRELSGFDLSKLDWISVSRTGFRFKETPDGLVATPFDGVCKAHLVDPDGREVELFIAGKARDRTPDIPPGLSKRYRINTRVYHDCRFPRTTRSGEALRTLDELLVWLIAHEAAHYLIPTGQLPGSNTEEACDAFAGAALAKLRATLSA